MGALLTALAAMRRALGAGARDRQPAPRAAVEAALLERLAQLPFEPRRVLEVGATSIDSLRVLARRWRGAQLLAVEVAPRRPHAGTARRWPRRYARVAAEAARLPFTDQSIDLAYSNLLLQRLGDVGGLLKEIQRLLRVGGCYCFSALGAGTLAELRAARGDPAPEAAFPDLLELGDALLHAGFVDPVIDADRHTLTYLDVGSLLRDLRLMGGRLAAHAPGLGGRERLRRLALAYEPARRADGRLPATFVVLYGRAFSAATPERGVPAEVTIAPTAIGRRRR